MGAYIRWSDSGDADAWWPFDEAAKEEFKRRIPPHARKWDADRRCWRVAAAWAEDTARWLEHRFPGARRINEPQARKQSGYGSTGGPATPIRPREPWATLHLLPTAPMEVVEAAYRALARLHHPDRGGSTLQMQVINGAYQQLKEVARR